MAIRKPLVIGANGLIEELRDVDSLRDASLDLQSFTAGEDVAAGDCLYLSAADTVKKAKADAMGTLPAMGFAYEAATSGNPVRVLLDGVVDGLTLTAGADYFVSAVTDGAIGTAVPTTTGQGVQRVGQAISTTMLLIEFGDAIRRG